VQTVPLTGAIIVTTPQEVAVIDAVKAANMFRIENINVPIIGIVENMAWFTPAELPENKYYLFGSGGGEKLSKELDVPLLVQLPLIQSVQQGGDQGSPVAMDENDISYKMWQGLSEKVIGEVNKRNEQLEPTKIVKIIHH